MNRVKFTAELLESSVKVMLESSFMGKPTSLELELSAEHYIKLETFLTRRAEGLSTGLIQEELPFLNAAQREFLVSGASPEAWEEAFGSHDDNE